LWEFGGRVADPSGPVVINSSGTVQALEHGRERAQHFVPGAASWLDPSKNTAFSAGGMSLNNDGISTHAAAQREA
jgi:hypothetical protein